MDTIEPAPLEDAIGFAVFESIDFLCSLPSGVRLGTDPRSGVERDLLL